MIHAKEVMRIIKEDFGKEEFTKKELASKVQDAFSRSIDTLEFHNCHGSTFSFETLLPFFVSKGKLNLKDNKYSCEPELNCSCSH